MNSFRVHREFFSRPLSASLGPDDWCGVKFATEAGQIVACEFVVQLIVVAFKYRRTTSAIWIKSSLIELANVLQLAKFVKRAYHGQHHTSSACKIAQR